MSILILNFILITKKCFNYSIQDFVFVKIFQCFILNRKNKNIYIRNNIGYDRKPDEISEFGMNQHLIVPNQCLSVNITSVTKDLLYVFSFISVLILLKTTQSHDPLQGYRAEVRLILFFCTMLCKVYTKIMSSYSLKNTHKMN